jgi:hypothetical protein
MQWRDYRHRSWAFRFVGIMFCSNPYYPPLFQHAWLSWVIFYIGICIEDYASGDINNILLGTELVPYLAESSNSTKIRASGVEESGRILLVMSERRKLVWENLKACDSPAGNLSVLQLSFRPAVPQSHFINNPPVKVPSIITDQPSSFTKTVRMPGIVDY